MGEAHLALGRHENATRAFKRVREARVDRFTPKRSRAGRFEVEWSVRSGDGRRRLRRGDRRHRLRIPALTPHQIPEQTGAARPGERGGRSPVMRLFGPGAFIGRRVQSAVVVDSPTVDSPVRPATGVRVLRRAQARRRELAQRARRASPRLLVAVP